MLEEVGATWLEEPFHGGAYDAYGKLAARSGKIKLAGGEASHNVHMARQLIDYGKVSYIQIDCGRIGGIGPAKQVADYAAERGVTYVNHTFTSHLALCASLQPYAGLEKDVICEYPFAPKSVAWDMSRDASDAGRERRGQRAGRAGAGHHHEPGGHGEVSGRRRDLGEGQGALPHAEAVSGPLRASDSAPAGRTPASARCGRPSRRSRR